MRLVGVLIRRCTKEDQSPSAPSLSLPRILQTLATYRACFGEGPALPDARSFVAPRLDRFRRAGSNRQKDARLERLAVESKLLTRGI